MQGQPVPLPAAPCPNRDIAPHSQAPHAGLQRAFIFFILFLSMDSKIRVHYKYKPSMRSKVISRTPSDMFSR